MFLPVGKIIECSSCGNSRVLTLGNKCPEVSISGQYFIESGSNHQGATFYWYFADGYPLSELSGTIFLLSGIKECLAMDFHVVAIAASGEGLKDIQTMFQLLPARMGVAFIVVFHLPRTPESKLATILARDAKMPVHKVVSTIKIQPDHIYVIAEGTYLNIKDGELHCQLRNALASENNSIDMLLHSLALAWKDRAIAIILSGMGKDGLQGAIDVEKAGGYVLTVRPERSRSKEMAYNVVLNNNPDAVMPVEELTAHLAQYISRYK